MKRRILAVTTAVFLFLLTIAMLAGAVLTVWRVNAAEQDAEIEEIDETEEIEAGLLEDETDEMADEEIELTDGEQTFADSALRLKITIRDENGGAYVLSPSELVVSKDEDDFYAYEVAAPEAEVPDVTTLTKASYRVTFDRNDGETLPETIYVAAGDSVPAPETPERTGYTFLGWYEEDAEEVFDLTLPVNRDLMLFARWGKETVQYQVTFDTKGGEEIPSQIVSEGDRAVRPSDPARDGFRFLGWSASGKAYDFTEAVTSDLTITARWETIPYGRGGLYTSATERVYSWEQLTTIGNIPNYEGKRAVIQMNGTAISAIHDPEFLSGILVIPTYVTGFDHTTWLSGCKNLTAVYFGTDGTTKLRTVPAYAFRNCEKLTKIVFREGITTFSANAFTGSALNDISFPTSTVTSIKYNSFDGVTLAAVEVDESYRYERRKSTLGNVDLYAGNGAVNADAINAYTTSNKETGTSNEDLTRRSKLGTEKKTTVSAQE